MDLEPLGTPGGVEPGGTRPEGDGRLLHMTCSRALDLSKILSMQLGKGNR